MSTTRFWYILLVLPVATCSNESEDPGLPQTTVINGTVDTDGIYPAVVKVLTDTPTGTQVCTGALLEGGNILTAAHCVCYSYVDQNGDTVEDAEHCYSATRVVFERSDNDTPVIHQATIKVNADYRAVYEVAGDLTYLQEIEADLAILELDSCGPEWAKAYELDTVAPIEGEDITVVGFGKDDCEDEFTDGIRRYGPNEIADVSGDWIEIEAEIGAGETTIWGGDSGGPLLKDDKIIGCASFANCFEDPGDISTGTYTNTYRFENWISSNMTSRDCACRCADSDADGYYEASCTNEGCGQLGDCNDNNSSVNPGATEIPYDSIDQDCNGSDLVDVDGDGYWSQLVSGFDCDDSNSAVYPGAPEVCDDSLDNDCDTYTDCDDTDDCGPPICITTVNLTLPVVKDIYVNENSTGTNYQGENLVAEMQKVTFDHYQKTILLDFNLDEELAAYSSSDYFISEARIHFYVKDIQGLSSVDTRISPIVTSWSEATVTWDTNETNGIDIRGGSGEVDDTISATGWFTTDLTNPSQKVFTGAYPVHNGYVVHINEYPASIGDIYELTLYSKEMFASRAAYLEVTLEPN